MAQTRRLPAVLEAIPGDGAVPAELLRLSSEPFGAERTLLPHRGSKGGNALSDPAGQGADLLHVSLVEAARYVEEGHFPSGSMLPKVEAAMKFIRANPDKKAIISSLDKAIDALEGRTGTLFTFSKPAQL